ncbi:hypothetical protein TcG_02685 [Trypanosoma cruzi]|nr:hypothetical protein TcG_02685 [Trypanosoma cruzi]
MRQIPVAAQRGHHLRGEAVCGTMHSGTARMGTKVHTSASPSPLRGRKQNYLRHTAHLHGPLARHAWGRLGGVAPSHPLGRQSSEHTRCPRASACQRACLEFPPARKCVSKSVYPRKKCPTTKDCSRANSADIPSGCLLR